jgi:asparagine synthase (glutamine-hydrolysing)
MEYRYVAEVVDLTDPNANELEGIWLDEARRRVGSGDARAIRGIAGSFAIAVRDGEAVRLARSLDRPLRYFLAKRADGPMLVVSDRIDAIRVHLASLGLAGQFQPAYTRMVPAHHVVTIRLVGCPDPDPVYERFFAPERGVHPAEPGEIGRRYVSALAAEVRAWLARVPESEPIGVCFSGGIDSGAVFLVVYHQMLAAGLSPSRLKAFTLSLGAGEDVLQAREFLERLDLGLFLEPIAADPSSLDYREAVRVVEDYKRLDVESATVAIALLRGIRERYPRWRHLADGEGGDENLKDYPIEENPELTIRSVLNNRMLYQEGWGVGTIKHSLTYSGGQSRAVTRTYAPLRRFGFRGFSPFMRPSVVEVAEGIPFVELTGWDPARLYALKGEIVSRGVESVTGLRMPVFPKRRFQDGAAQPGFRLDEAACRREFAALYA